jgi:hypothetical protein
VDGSNTAFVTCRCLTPNHAHPLSCRNVFAFGLHITIIPIRGDQWAAGDGRFIQWARKTTRPSEMWPEQRSRMSKPNQQLARKEWRIEVKRRGVVHKVARRRKIIRERDGVSDQVVPPSIPVALAMAAVNVYFEAWKPWLHEVCERCDITVPAMPLLQEHLDGHMLPPQHRQKFSDMPWNCCVARPMFDGEM